MNDAEQINCYWIYLLLQIILWVWNKATVKRADENNYWLSGQNTQSFHQNRGIYLSNVDNVERGSLLFLICRWFSNHCNYSLVHGVPELVTKHSNNQQGKTGVETHTDKFLLCKVHFLQLPHFLLVFFLEFLCSFFLQKDTIQMH